MKSNEIAIVKQIVLFSILAVVDKEFYIAHNPLFCQDLPIDYSF